MVEDANDGQAGRAPESANQEHSESGLLSEFVDTIAENKGTIATVVGIAAATGLIIVSRGKLKGLADDVFRGGRTVGRTLPKAGDEVLAAGAKAGDDVATLSVKERVVQAATTGGDEAQPMLTAIRRASSSGQLNPDVGAYIPGNRTLQRQLLTERGTVRHLGNEVEGTSDIAATAQRLRKMLKG